MTVAKTVLAWVMAYLIGSIPAGLFWAWVTKKVDVRQHGSGRTGGGNVWRTAGFGAAVLTVLSDALKGAAAIFVARAMGLSAWAMALAGTLAVVGHNHSIFLKFHGGAGTMTSLGVIAAYSWTGVLAVFVVPALLIVWLVGHTSVASIYIALVMPLFFALRGDLPTALAFALPTMALTLWSLRPNIRRLYRREERFIQPYKKNPPPICISRHPAKEKRG